jgi:hypothetical protein
MTASDENRIERRCGQRFPYQLPVLLRMPNESLSGAGVTQDLSSRGAMVWTDFPVTVGVTLEMSLIMPSEIMLAEAMDVCCRARVVRVESSEGQKTAIAVQIEHYDFPHRVAAALQQHAPVHLNGVRS